MRGLDVISPFAECTSPRTYDLSAEVDGIYTFSVRQRDQWGNLSSAKTDTLTLDRFVADPPITSGPSDLTSDPHPSWTFDVSVGLSSECRLWRGNAVVIEYANCSSPKTFDLSGDVDGAYTFQVRQKDEDGNISAGATDDFTLDRSPPPPTITEGPSDPSHQSSLSWSFTGSPGNAFECRLDLDEITLGSFTPCSSPVSYDLSENADGTYNFSVREVDGSGHHSNPASDSVALDRYVPGPSIQGDVAHTADSTPTWTISAQPGTSLECKLERTGSVVHEYEPCSTEISYELAGEPDGDYTFDLRAIDEFGNHSAEVGDAFVLDRFVPSPVLTSDPGAIVEFPGPSWTFTGLGDNAFECRLERGETVVHPFETCSSPQTYDLNAEANGSYSFSVRQKDSFGNVSAPAIDAFSYQKPGVEIAVDQWDVNESTGVVTYNVTMRATGTASTGTSPCYHDCIYQIDLGYVENGVEQVQQGLAYQRVDASSVGSTTSLTVPMSGSTSMLEVTHIRAQVYAVYGGDHFDTGWTRLHQAYGGGSVNLDINSWEASGDWARFDVYLHYDGARRVGAPCEGRCRLAFDVRYADGSIDTRWWSLSYDPSWTGGESVNGTLVSLPSEVVQVRAKLEAFPSGARYLGPWHHVGSHPAGFVDIEVNSWAGKSNPAQYDIDMSYEGAASFGEPCELRCQMFFETKNVAGQIIPREFSPTFSTDAGSHHVEGSITSEMPLVGVRAHLYAIDDPTNEYVSDWQGVTEYTVAGLDARSGIAFLSGLALEELCTGLLFVPINTNSTVSEPYKLCQGAVIEGMTSEEFLWALVQAFGVGILGYMGVNAGIHLAQNVAAALDKPEGSVALTEAELDELLPPPDPCLSDSEKRAILESLQMPDQEHHFLTDKSGTYTKGFSDLIEEEFGHSLDEPWNIESMPHRGRHPSMVWEWVGKRLRIIVDEADGDWVRFTDLFDRYIKEPILNDPLFLRKVWWDCYPNPWDVLGQDGSAA